ncbi:M1 family metallopeptidase [Granulicella sibirica]|uniref:Zn-dependent aminopeptidase n=1 Tax=Granulicella sibirica TaxID=2479048 RepID=A0A4V1L5Z2_9BACT|nr:M1 family metallopeptidase [Granulicella sibirica]RXH57454.1 Zn-dependent aminopeptidase [Granulicella sibirica]
MPHPLRLALLTLVAAVPACAQSVSATNSPNGAPLSTRVVAYNLEAKVDPAHHALDATESLTYKNLTGQPLTTFPFHLYLNAFRPQSTFTTETHFGGGIRDSDADNTYDDKKLGSIDVSHIDATGYGDLTPTLHFTAPDDGNSQDHTVAEITLPRPLAPGDSVTFNLTFHDKFPLSVARNGYKRDFLMGGQWYPKLGVFWHGAWNCHQYHATTEFFSDFGTFNVHLTIPQRYVVGASGIPTGETSNPDDTKTLGFYAEDVGDFAFAASPHFKVTDGTFLSSMGPVKIHVLALAAHPQAGPRYLKIMQDTMAQFDHRYGPFPYKIITVIDPEPDSEIFGMEYPTLITAGTFWFEPTNGTENVTEHEFGHQYWYGMVATNEFEDAWLDEGINSYTEVKVTGAILGRRTNFINFPWANLADASLQRLQYMGAVDQDPVTRHAWQFKDANSYSGITYGKSATLLATLEGIVGTDVMDEAMRIWFMRYRFTHPTTEDFLHTIEEVAIAHGKATPLAYTPATGGSLGAPPSTTSSSKVGGGATTPGASLIPGFTPTQFTFSGTTLRPFFNQAVYGTAVLDYMVDSINSDPVQWWLPEDPKATTQYLDTVVVRRKGDFILPVTVEIVFEDGTRLREQWDGIDRWHRFAYTKNTKIVSAEVDPDHIVLMDRDFFNNSITTAGNTIPARKLSTLWNIFEQLYAQFSTWIV